ncbi:MAG TPA: hypothetical protein VNZ64_13120 [Candidatus Acidoferrum sp.]|jgi:hypothetical protein|nr:hypothetical protein [Candidatus Acidoferrum sp.]
MNTKAMSMEIVTAMGAPEEACHADDSSARPRLVLFEHRAIQARPCLGLRLRPAGSLAGEAWETVSYLALWLCGCLAVGLCFL